MKAKTEPKLEVDQFKARDWCRAAGTLISVWVRRGTAQLSSAGLQRATGRVVPRYSKEPG